MSVSSILAFVLAGVAAKNRRPDRQVENLENRQELIALRIDNSDLRRELDQARQDYDALRRENAAQARALSGPPRGLGQHPLQQHELALQQAAAAMQAQQSQLQLAQYQHYQAAAQNQGLGQAMGLLGAQSLINAELWCNCVPSRSQVWAADRT